MLILHLQIDKLNISWFQRRISFRWIIHCSVDHIKTWLIKIYVYRSIGITAVPTIYIRTLKKNGNCSIQDTRQTEFPHIKQMDIRSFRNKCVYKWWYYFVIVTIRMIHNFKLHPMDMLWEEFQWILPLYMKPIKGFSCLFSHHGRIYWLLPEETKYVFPTCWLKKREYLNPADQIPAIELSIKFMCKLLADILLNDAAST